MTVEIVTPQNDVIVAESRRPSAKFGQWLGLMTELEPISGTGDPEGVQEARKKRFYIDEDGDTGTILYVKLLDDIDGNRKKGWKLV
ncbi:MAG: hypothetical protein V3V23_00195 [Dehalococcoidales bacterium]